jgi:hypothetical protein
MPGVIGVDARQGSRAQQRQNPRFILFRSFEFEALEFVSDFVLRI